MCIKFPAADLFSPRETGNVYANIRNAFVQLWPHSHVIYGTDVE